MKKKSNIGRKVKITGKVIGGGEYQPEIGDEGTIVNDQKQSPWEEGVIEVRMDNGKTANLWAPWYKDTECELLPEENYNIESIKGQKIAIHCKSQEEWDAVREVIQSVGIHTQPSNIYRQYERGEGYCTNIETMQEHCRKEYYEGLKYKIITAQEFITANQPTDMTTTEKIEALEKQLQELKESLNWKPKVGDWVVVVKPDTFSTNKVGQCSKILEINKSGWHRLQEDSDTWELVKNIRKATLEEIERATPKEIKVTIGTESKEVVISKGKIVAPDGKTVDIKDINKVCGIMMGTKGFNSWTVTFPTVKIGCIEGITYDQLQAVQEAYSKLTNN